MEEWGVFAAKRWREEYPFWRHAKVAGETGLKDIVLATPWHWIPIISTSALTKLLILTSKRILNFPVMPISGRPITVGKKWQNNSANNTKIL